MPAERDPELIEQVYRRIEQRRMAPMDLCHPQLSVMTLGFERALGPAKNEPGWSGILLTPWCMNLIWWPDAADAVAAPGQSRVHHFGMQQLAFLGSWESQLGAFEACSLFSPMDAFADLMHAQATAMAVLQQLREAVQQQVMSPQNESRRALLTGRLPGSAG